MEVDGFGEGFVAEDVEDGGEGLVLHEVGLVGNLDEGWADVEGFGGDGLRAVLRPLWRFRPRLCGGFDGEGHAVSTGDLGAEGAGFGESALHGGKGLGVDEGADEGVRGCVGRRR